MGAYLCTVLGRAAWMLSGVEIWCWVRAGCSKASILTRRDDLFSFRILSLSYSLDSSLVASLHSVLWNCKWGSGSILLLEWLINLNHWSLCGFFAQCITIWRFLLPKGHSRTRELDTVELLEQLPALQQLLHRLLGCQVLHHDQHFCLWKKSLGSESHQKILFSMQHIELLKFESYKLWSQYEMWKENVWFW